MKKIIRTGDLCCERCANRYAKKMMIAGIVNSAKGIYKKNVILIDCDASVSDNALIDFLKNEGVEVFSIEVRKGLFF